jgi:hypothetical protein
VYTQVFDPVSDPLGLSSIFAASPSAWRARKGDIFRRVLLWSIALTLVMCVLVYQATDVAGWMVV